MSLTQAMTACAKLQIQSCKNRHELIVKKKNKNSYCNVNCTHLFNFPKYVFSGRLLE